MQELLEISPSKVVQVIFQAREKRLGEAELRGFIAAMNDDEKASLVALTWIGRETFEADELEEAITTAKAEATSPTEDYLVNMPLFADYLEAGLEAIGISPADVEEEFFDR
ncbi:DUF3775 domain-containing protein [Rhodovulum sp. MB263]|uniref:DUF3775 domain-containing protein n=1 Tax=Rhodovulum sp. (strain MB263) TaxID=308754 RepID=UPI0009B7C1DA|nr:DUF3775 domain-containing protein [Rhodovulum sp. MB263]ARC87422.1 hypothetical protein B5V46_01655 [Rhodovulum sp. MB263]